MCVVHIACQKLGASVEKDGSHEQKQTFNVQRLTSNVEMKIKTN